MLEKIVEPLLAAREAMWREFAKLHREVLMIVKEDQVCRRLMTRLLHTAEPAHHALLVQGAELVEQDQSSLPLEAHRNPERHGAAAGGH